MAFLAIRKRLQTLRERCLFEVVRLCAARINCLNTVAHPAAPVTGYISTRVKIRHERVAIIASKSANHVGNYHCCL